jgi:hypothetical protein
MAASSGCLPRAISRTSSLSPNERPAKASRACGGASNTPADRDDGGRGLKPVSPDHDPWNRERPRGAERYRWARVCPAQAPDKPHILATTSKNGE